MVVAGLRSGLAARPVGCCEAACSPPPPPHLQHEHHLAPSAEVAAPAAENRAGGKMPILLAPAIEASAYFTRSSSRAGRDARSSRPYDQVVALAEGQDARDVAVVDA